MPRILITGNGFDLHHKLPTTYKDFIKIVSYLINNQTYGFDEIYGNCDSFQVIKENFNNDFRFEEKSISLLKELANKNILFNFFQKELEIDTWIDFENKIEYLLKNIYLTIIMLRAKVVSNGPFHTSYYPFTILQNNITFISILNFFNIVELNGEYFRFNHKFLIKKYDYYVDIDEEKILNLIYSQLIEFRKIFNLYLQNFVIPLYDKYKTNDHIVNIFSNIDYYFTFNYTPTFEKLYNAKRINVNYLHGKSESTNENIVLGINELFNKDCNNEYIKFTKYYQKFDNKTDFFFLNNIEFTSFENYIFYFWGHSLDKSDAGYVNEVFDKIDSLKSEIKRIIVIFHNDGSRSKSLLNLFAIRGREDIEKKMREKKLLFYKIGSEDLENDLKQNISKQLFFP